MRILVVVLLACVGCASAPVKPCAPVHRVLVGVESGKPIWAVYGCGACSVGARELGR